MPTRPANIYLHFLQLAENISGSRFLPGLDPLEQRIFELIARAGLEGSRLSVRDVMAKVEFGAPMTVHNRLKSLREKGWIRLADTEDTRRKQVELTSAAFLHLDRLSGCLVQAASHS
jgi:hypothetical protein